ncbi:calcium-binding and coiled-coil domain-containing protein 1-like [Arapaima gigas]
MVVTIEQIVSLHAPLCPRLFVAMETGKVKFQNVGLNYFPQSRVECHYSLSAQHTWASSDWIGLFKLGWSSVRDYHTFVWALTPQGYMRGSSVNCCVHFQASYLPSPSAEEYQFVYVDGKGEVCACSPPFTFSFPRPLDDVVTVEEGQVGEGAEEEMLLVVPRAELLQTRLEECLKECAELLQAKERAERGQSEERKKKEKAQVEWDRIRKGLERDIHDLKEKLGKNRENVEQMEEKQKEAQCVHEALIAEKDNLMAAKAENIQRIKDLEVGIKALTQQGLEREKELERMKEKIKNMSAQRQDEAVERRRLQSKLAEMEGELRSLAADYQDLRASLAQRDTQVLQLRHSITTLTHRLNTAQGKEVEREASLSEMSCFQERLSASVRIAEGLRTQLAEQSSQQDRNQSELHQARLQAAQLTLQLADTNLALKEGRAAWAQEREELCCKWQEDKERVWKLSAEVQQKEEWLQEERMERGKLEVELAKEKDCHRVQLNEVHRELQELRSSLLVAQKEKEQHLLEKQALCFHLKELMEYTVQLERRLEVDGGWNDKAFNSNSHPPSPLSISEDENPEALQPQRPGGPLGPYSRCDSPQNEVAPSDLQGLTHELVVVSQPVSISSSSQQLGPGERHSSAFRGSLLLCLEASSWYGLHLYVCVSETGGGGAGGNSVRSFEL